MRTLGFAAAVFSDLVPILLSAFTEQTEQNKQWRKSLCATIITLPQLRQPGQATLSPTFPWWSIWCWFIALGPWELYYFHAGFIPCCKNSEVAPCPIGILRGRSEFVLAFNSASQSSDCESGKVLTQIWQKKNKEKRHKLPLQGKIFQHPDNSG